MGPPWRRVPLYTWELTPRFELPEDYRRILDPILVGEPYKGEGVDAAYPWFRALSAQHRDKLVQYCEELDRLHEDLDFALFDLETATVFVYEDLYHRRLALAYHADNVDMRVHAYREKTFKLVNYFFGGLAEDDEDPRLNNKVFDELRERGRGRVVARLREFRGDAQISAALERRKLFVHYCADRSGKPMLTPSQWIEEQISEVRGLGELEQLMNFEELLKRTREEIDEICERLAGFRYRLVAELKASFQ